MFHWSISHCVSEYSELFHVGKIFLFSRLKKDYLWKKLVFFDPICDSSICNY